MFKSTVDKITSKLDGIVKDLEYHATSKEQEIKHHILGMEHANLLRRAAENEKARAERVAAKLREIIS